MWRGLADFSHRGWGRVIVSTATGTIFCIGVAFGVDYYVHGGWGPKPYNNLLIPLILAPPFFFYLLAQNRALAQAHHELMVIASTDALTDCLNRRAFKAMVEAYLEKATGYPGAETGALLVLDVDHFKRVNDSFGHDAGDEALRIVARGVKGAVRSVDLVGRIGGEEFGVFLPNAGAHAAETTAERVRNAVEQSVFRPLGKPYRLTVSVGGAIVEHTAGFDLLFHLADQRLLNAKRKGRNRVDVSGAVTPVRLVVSDIPAHRTLHD